MFNKASDSACDKLFNFAKVNIDVKSLSGDVVVEELSAAFEIIRNFNFILIEFLPFMVIITVKITVTVGVIEIVTVMFTVKKRMFYCS